MSAFMVDKIHVDLLVSTAMHGTRGGEIRPDRAWRSPTWPEVPYRDLQELGWQEAAAKIHTVREDHIGTQDHTPDRVGLMLAMENWASINHRYPDTVGHPENAPGPVDCYWLDYSYANPGYKMTPVEALQAISCYEYQSCEHPGWHDSEAKRFCDALRLSVIRQLDGIDDAPWSWSVEKVAERRQGMFR